MMRLPCMHPNGKWGYISQTGRWMIEPVYDFASPYAKSDIAAVGVGNNGDRTLVDLNGRSLFAPRHYADLTPLEDGCAIAVADNCPIVIDRLGEERWRSQCEDLAAAGPGLYVEWHDSWERCRLVRTGGEPVIDKVFRELQVYADREIVLTRDESGYALMDFGANVLRAYSHDYDHLGSFDEMGRAVFSSHGMCGVISEDESLVLPPIFRSIDFCFGRSRTVVTCRDDENWTFDVYDATNRTFVARGFEYVAPSTDENMFWGFNGSWSLYWMDGSCIAHDVCMKIICTVGSAYQGLIDGDGRMFYCFVGPNGLETVRCRT